MSVDKSMQVILEMVRSEIHTQLQAIVPLIVQDIKELSDTLLLNQNDLLTRIEALEGLEPIPAQLPKPKDVEL